MDHSDPSWEHAPSEHPSAINKEKCLGLESKGDKSEQI